jgi:apolipoprotein N-acyltransferase
MRYTFSTHITDLISNVILSSELFFSFLVVSVMKIKSFLLITISAIFLILSFPKSNQSFFVWFALIPLLFAVEGKSVYKNFLAGWLCGFLFYVGLMYWIVVVTTTYGGLIYPLGILVMLLLVTYLSIYLGLSLALARFIEDRTPFTLPLIFPFIWVTLEYIRSFAFSGFPWESLGYSLYQAQYFIQCADITGIYGISFLIVFTNVTGYLLLRGIPQKKIPWKEVVLTILLLSAALLYGKGRIATIAKISETSPSVQVGLIQGNIDQGIKWNRAFRQQAIAIHQDLSVKALKKGVRLIIWPESSTPFYFQSELDYQRIIFNIINGTDTFLLMGSPFYDQKNGMIRNFNSAFLLAPTGEILGRYDKMHLVPYGEYIPLKQFFPFINKMVVGIGNFYSGDYRKILHLPEVPLGVLICYEIIFPDLTRRFVKDGAQFLVNITNDAWFGKTSAPHQHLSMAVVRAIENRRFIARAANTGISAIIDASGQIQSSSKLFTETLLTGTIRTLTIQTFYSRYGDVFAYLSVLFTIVLITFALLRRLRA